MSSAGISSSLFHTAFQQVREVMWAGEEIPVPLAQTHSLPQGLKEASYDLVPSDTRALVPDQFIFFINKLPHWLGHRDTQSKGETIFKSHHEVGHNNPFSSFLHSHPHLFPIAYPKSLK